MGMFTWVEPADEILPSEFHGLKDWQTKDVIDDHQLETLEITPDGRLIYIWWEREWRENEESFFGGYFYPTVEHRDELDYHGDMNFYTDKEISPTEWEWIEFKARFTDGKLQSLEQLTFDQ